MLQWNKTLWLDTTSHLTIFNQLEVIVSLKQVYATLKFVYEIKSRLMLLSLPPLPTHDVDPFYVGTYRYFVYPR